MMARNSDPVRQSDPAPGVRLLTLSLPKLRNAMTAELTEAWTDAVEDIKADPQVRARRYPVRVAENGDLVLSLGRAERDGV